MSLLDIFKRRRREQGVIRDEPTFLAPKPITNKQYQQKREREVNYLERIYDLSTVEGINAIPVPRKRELPTSSLPNVTERIEYNLLLRGGRYEKAGEIDLALACFRKANELIPMSPIAYPRDSYMRLPRYLRKLRRFDEARDEELKISLNDPSDGVFELSQAEFISDMLAVGHTKTHARELYKEYKADRDAEHKKVLYRADYDWLWEFMPEICPKSFSGYMRMKNTNTERYQKIVAEAKKRGYQIR